MEEMGPVGDEDEGIDLEAELALIMEMEGFAGPPESIDVDAFIDRFSEPSVANKIADAEAASSIPATFVNQDDEPDNTGGAASSRDGGKGGSGHKGDRCDGDGDFAAHAKDEDEFLMQAESTASCPSQDEIDNELKLMTGPRFEGMDHDDMVADAKLTIIRRRSCTSGPMPVVETKVYHTFKNVSFLQCGWCVWWEVPESLSLLKTTVSEHL